MREPIQKAVAFLLKTVRLLPHLGMSAEAFCAHTQEVDPGAGWSFSTYRKWENGQRTMSLPAICQFAEYAGADTVELTMTIDGDKVSVVLFDAGGSEPDYEMPMISSGDIPKCQGHTKSGHACMMNAKAGTGYCWRHQEAAV